MVTTTGRRPTLAEIREIADEALAHERSVERRILGLRVRGRVGERIDAVLIRRGIIEVASTDEERAR